MIPCKSFFILFMLFALQLSSLRAFQGTAREEMMCLSRGSYYDNLAMDSDRGDGENSIM